MRGNKNNIKPTKATIEKAQKGLLRAYKAGRINKAQYEGLLRGLKKRAKAI